ncbi:MAG: hypothetical protein ACKVWR_12810 [Acidimicrobiales bacterium]
MGIDEYVDLDLEEFDRRSLDRLRSLIERSRPSIERELGAEFSVQERKGRLELRVGERTVYTASTTAAGRLLLTDVSGRFTGRL